MGCFGFGQNHLALPFYFSMCRFELYHRLVCEYDVMQGCFHSCTNIHWYISDSSRIMILSILVTKLEAYVPQCQQSTSTGETEVTRPVLIEELCMKLGLSPNLARVMDKESNSHKNLASSIVRSVFSAHEREASNVRGLKRKKRLNPARMEMIRALTFTLRPLKLGESEEDVWKEECIKVVDSANRKPLK